MSLTGYLKSAVERLPRGIGQPLAYVPFGLRLGIEYPKSRSQIRRSERCDLRQLDQERFATLRSLLLAAVEQTAFYRDFYRANSSAISELQSWEDWQRLPIVTKSDMQAYSLLARTAVGTRGMKVNTGGTSGQPLEFYLDGEAFAREWAHMHHVWRAHGYSPKHLKLTFRGKHFDVRRVLRYNAVHNEYVVNANAPMDAVVEAVAALPPRTVIRWLHGYPSLVAEFADACRALPSGTLALFRSRLFGALLGSEYPARVYRSVIEDVLTANVVSWYGHSEMAMLARETARGIYESLPTYGYAEAVPAAEGGAYRLVCTGLHNRAHPFIRYDTGDLIEPLSQACGSLAFRVVEGRVGDFIVDRNGKKHSLTAIIFGRHHNAFDSIKHIQVRQDAVGKVTFLVTPRNSQQDDAGIRAGLDLSDLDLEWGVELVAEPVRTIGGKIQLKVAAAQNPSDFSSSS